MTGRKYLAVKLARTFRCFGGKALRRGRGTSGADGSIFSMPDTPQHQRSLWGFQDVFWLDLSTI